jgi:hypothetical protein
MERDSSKGYFRPRWARVAHAHVSWHPEAALWSMGGGGARTLGHLHVASLHSLPHKSGQHVWADPGTMCLQLIRHVVETIPNRVLHMPRLP